jgi:hypothetical protein
MFRFEKFMEENADEFEIVEDEAIEEEEYYDEKVTYVSGEEVSAYTDEYEEETLDASLSEGGNVELPVFRPATKSASL